MSTTHTIDPAHWHRLLADGRHHELSQQIIDALTWYSNHTFTSLSPQDRETLNQLLSLIFSILIHPAFTLPDELALPLISLNPTIANLTALSMFQNTDPQLAALRSLPNNLPRILALYSARNTIRYDLRDFFSHNPLLASVWYVQYAKAYHAGLASPAILQNLREHFANLPESLLPITGIQELFFASTYIDPVADRTAKSRLNQIIRRHTPSLTITNRPNPRKIALLSSHWRSGHSVHRILFDFVRALKPHYHLTLFDLGNHAPHDASLFDEVRIIPSFLGIPDPAPLLSNDFQLLFYPDVGMSDESLFLANLRLAPIQIAALGHSVSTFGAEIDYFVSGAAVESPDNPQQHYSEQLLLLPGMGCAHLPPAYPKPDPKPEPAAIPLLINCPWSAQKINFPFLQTIAKLLKSCTRPLRLQIFESGASIRNNGFLPFKQALTATLRPDQFELIINLPYGQYMAKLQSAHLALDSFHFGGCNTVSDSLYLGIPMICWQGKRWYNRIGPEMLRLAGIPELIATTETQYLATAHQLIHNDTLRHALRTRLQKTNLSATIYNPSDAQQFKQAIDRLIQKTAQ